MGEAVEYSLSHLTAHDIKAMTAYLRTIPPHPAPGEAPVEQRPQAVAESTAVTPPQREADTESLGLEIFQSACASCHAYDGTGINDPRAALLGSQTVNDPHGINLIQVLLRGSHVRIEQTKASMPAFAAYRDVELAAVANYVISHFGAKSAQISPGQIAHAPQAQ